MEITKEQIERLKRINESQDCDFVRDVKRYGKLYGYEIGLIFVEFGYLKIQIKPKNKYTPRIFQKFEMFKEFDFNPIFELSTSSYGDLSVEEFEKYLHDLQNGLKMVEKLNGLYWENVPVI